MSEIPRYVLERAEAGAKDEHIRNFDTQILDYIRWQDAQIEEMQDKINNLEYQLAAVIDEMRLHDWRPDGLRLADKSETKRKRSK